MTENTKTREYKIDATDKKLGRLASEIAVILMGKDSLDYAKHNVADVQIQVDNVSKISISKEKLSDKRYKSYSGYPGGLKEKSANEIIEKHGYEGILRNAVKGMLPGNKLRDRMLKNLKVSE